MGEWSITVSQSSRNYMPAGDVGLTIEKLSSWIRLPGTESGLLAEKTSKLKPEDSVPDVFSFHTDKEDQTVTNSTTNIMLDVFNYITNNISRANDCRNKAAAS